MLLEQARSLVDRETASARRGDAAAASGATRNIRGSPAKEGYLAKILVKMLFVVLSCLELVALKLELAPTDLLHELFSHLGVLFKVLWPSTFRFIARGRSHLQ